MPNKVIAWVEQHPTESVVIGVGGLVVMLWLLGFFSSSKGSSADAGTANMAAAYYAAEAQQAVVGGQIQVANIQATRDTAIAGLETGGAVAINNANANAAMTINQQNADVSTNLGYDQLLSTYSNNATTQYVTSSNNATAEAINANNNQTAIYSNYIDNVLPTELAIHGAQGFQTWIPGGGHYSTGGFLTPNQAASMGYTANQWAASTGLPVA